VPSDPLLAELETYYDTAPRASARTEEVGPFTLFVPTDPDGYPYYARPRLGLARAVTGAEVAAVLARQDELGLPRAIEWVHETTPSLLAAVREVPATAVQESPLLVLRDARRLGDAGGGGAAGTGGRVRVRVLDAEDADLGRTLGAVSAGFGGRDAFEPKATVRRTRLIREGLVVTAAAYDDRGEVVGGGSHAPRGRTTELAGIAVVPRARRQGLGEALTTLLARDARDRGLETVFLSAQDDAVARIYERVGFERVGTACIATAAAS
jgi:ribosomal protein S18 acetylase RimI-like enzyme